MPTVEVTLVRHAETVSNRTGIWQGQGDSHLSEQGREQAARLAARLRGARYDRVVCSDLRRTCDTLDTVGLEGATYDAAWREIDVGRWEGLSRDEVRERYGDEIEALKRGEPIRIGGGESWSDLERRADAAFARLRAALGEGERALVMTHGGVIHALVSGVLGLRDRRLRPIGRVMNTSMTTLRLHGSEGELSAVEVLAYNDASHVGPESEYLREGLAAGAKAVAVLSVGGAADAPPTPDEVEACRVAAAAWHPAFVATPVALDGGVASIEQLFEHADAGRVRAAVAAPGVVAALAHAVVGGPAAATLAPLGAGRLAHFVQQGPEPSLGDYALAPVPFFEP